MIQLRRAQERGHHRRRKQEVWRTFDSPDGANAFAGGFGSLESLDENLVPPGAGVAPHGRHAAELITYVRDGALAYDDSTGRSGVIYAGEFRRSAPARGERQDLMNPSRVDWAQAFRIGLRPSGPILAPGHEHKRFSAAERRGKFCLIASPDASKGSLRVQQDALVFSALLEPGQHVVHELASRRCVWCHVVRGEVTVGDIVLTTGDGAGFTEERAVSLTARGASEVLLLELGDPSLPGSGEILGDRP